MGSKPIADSLRWAAVLTIALVAITAVAAIDPADRTVWWIENLLPVFLVGYLAVTARSFPLSHLSYTTIFIFLCIHQIGAYYTYVNVPYDAALRSIGFSADGTFGSERNHYDRFAHLAYGVLLAYPLHEVTRRLVGAGGFWGYFLPVSLVMSTSLLYEFIEWGIASRLNPEQMAAFLGTQDDRWDSHWDLLAASAGSIVAMLVTAAFDSVNRSDFTEQWRESVRVKRHAPLGSDGLRSSPVATVADKRDRARYSAGHADNG